MTQDNTPPAPIFKARLLHIRINVDIKQGVVSLEISRGVCYLVSHTVLLSAAG